MKQTQSLSESSTMSAGTEISDSLMTRTLSEEISEVETIIRLGVDLVSATRKNIRFLRTVNESPWLHERSTVLEAIRRYDELWMPLISDLTVGVKPPMVRPPIDIEWVWFCHSLNPVSYRQYCESRFSKLIGKPAIFDEENEEYALLRCREIWVQRYPSESFENEVDSDYENPICVTNEDVLSEVKKQRFLYSKFSEPYMCETVFLIASRQRYKGFLFMLNKISDGCSLFVPASDIQPMWLTHMSYPTVYAEDLKDMWDDMGKVAGVWVNVKAKEVEETKKLWEKTFGQPYEKAGGVLPLTFDGAASIKPSVYWNVVDTDVNTKYKSMSPRFLLEACVSLKLISGMKVTEQGIKRDFLRLRVIRCHKELKLDQPVSNIPHNSWQKAWHLYCEFGTRGLKLERHHLGGACFKGSSTLRGTVEFHWNNLLRAPSLTMERQIEQVRVVTSITPPVQAPYLLKCVPDKVTDDSGAMISDVILRLNRYRPQEGRWLSRTVLDHAGRECFVVRMRVGGGFWRRGGETPSAVKWEDRIIEIREGPWSYVAGSIGRAPEKVVGSATPKEPMAESQAAWDFSTGYELIVSWESSASKSGLKFTLKNQTSPDSSLVLLRGQKMHYQWKNQKIEELDKIVQEEEEEEDNEGFVTLIRFTEENPNGKATALLNWKLLVVELMPEEDAVLVLLLCISILRSVSEMRKEDVGSLLIRRRIKEAKLGLRDWGSVTLHPSSSAIASPYVQPWSSNTKAVMAGVTDYVPRKPAQNYSMAEGGDKLYERGVIR